MLAKMHGQPMPESMTKGQQLAQLQGQKLVCYGPQTKFRNSARRTEICELFEQIGSVIDEMCIIWSMTEPICSNCSKISVPHWPNFLNFVCGP